MFPTNVGLREIVYRLVNCSSPRISLVKGERYIRGFEEKPEWQIISSVKVVMKHPIYIRGGGGAIFPFTNNQSFLHKSKKIRYVLLFIVKIEILVRQVWNCKILWRHILMKTIFCREIRHIRTYNVYYGMRNKFINWNCWSREDKGSVCI